MKRKRPTERERQIYEWKCLGKGISWSRWCHMNGYKVHHSRPGCPALRSGCPPARFDAQNDST